MERPRDALEVESLYQEHGVLLLAIPHEAVQLFLERPRAVRGLLLVSPERAQVVLLRENALHFSRSDRPRQLVLEVARAGVEPEALELAAGITPQRAEEMPLLSDVVEPCEPDVAVLLEETWQVPVAAHRHDGDALGLEVAATATGKCLDGAAVARALDEYYPVQLHSYIRSSRRRTVARLSGPASRLMSSRVLNPVTGFAVVDTSRIAAIPILADLPAEELDELGAAMREVNVEPGAEVVTLDDWGTAVYFIEQGEAEVLLGGGEPTQALGPGDAFGEISLILTGERTATVVAHTPMRLLSLPGQDFERIRERVPELERSLRRLGEDRAARS